MSTRPNRVIQHSTGDLATVVESFDEQGIHTMGKQSVDALCDFLFQLADDDLVFGHRSSEWLGLAPDLEEDIAFSSIAQDEVGHAAFYYGLLSRLLEVSEDSLAFERAGSERRNARLLEQQNGDWAYTIVRSYLYNAFEQVRLKALQQSCYRPLQQGAVKILREERYHFLHMETWFERLGIAGGEAKQRMDLAITQVWADLADLFSLGEFEQTLVETGIFPNTRDRLYQAWLSIVQPAFDRAKLTWPGDVGGVDNGDKSSSSPADENRNGRLGAHTGHLDELLGTMTEVHQIDVGAKW